MPRAVVVKVRPGAKIERVKEVNGVLHIWTTAPPEKGRANARVVTLLANYLDVPKRAVHLTAGQHRREKIITIYEQD